jgi:deoxyribose-phosphate aldolase
MFIGEVKRQTSVNKKATPIHMNMKISNIFRKKCGTIRNIIKPKKVIDQRHVKVVIQKGLLPKIGKMIREYK